MHLHVKHPNGQQRDYHFTRGPIYVGRHSECQLQLHNRQVSRQHAVIFSSPQGDIMIQDLGSANGTYVNNHAAHQTLLHSGDCIRIADFVIQVDLEVNPHTDSLLHLDDTLTGVAHEPQVIVRELQVEHAPDITLPAKRAHDFARACKRICQAHGPQDSLETIVDILFDQFHPTHAWCALREHTEGPMDYEAGRDNEGHPILLHDLELAPRIILAVQQNQFLLLPQNASSAPIPHLRSAMIAPLLETAGSVGVLYLDNRHEGEHYSLRDLDYLILLAIHIAAVYENF